MRLTSHPLAADNLARCRSMWGDRALATAAELDEAIEKGAVLLRQGRARGTLIVDEYDRPRYFGLTAFVGEAFADDVHARPHPRLGARVFREWTAADRTLVLDEEGIARRNAEGGMQMLVLNQGWDIEDEGPDAWPMLLGTLLKDFIEVHRGYRMARMFGEIFGADGVDIVTRSGAWATLRPSTLVTRDGAMLSSTTFSLTRQQAHTQWSTLMPMFAYSPPRILFTPPERALLLAALDGGTDEALAARLGVAVSAVKARWTRIQHRVADRLPQLLPKADGSQRTRGAQTRHVLLDFVRHNPAELTPYPRAGTRRLAWGHREGVTASDKPD